MVVDCDEVDEERRSADQSREQECSKHHLLDPRLAYSTGPKLTNKTEDTQTKQTKK